ncbi:PDZ domain-containing protein [Microbispora sp. SCL1-1]|uniref:Trypsin-like peptidase domain-containing protein n=1 Tax=Microbispora hainanensis TaxID=568844 RepID=A0ABZ1SPR3_9ACTN|nr:MULTISPECIES: trypsin-like peptidase domain-containing protein [Microbispora]NJP29442.1 PDZ domain-containing protein [Microbispora sp. CL1-1]TQS05101.1 PDZ domain-containing protein [Microbispora sp. SCL1-1]
MTDNSRPYGASDRPEFLPAGEEPQGPPDGPAPATGPYGMGPGWAPPPLYPVGPQREPRGPNIALFAALAVVIALVAGGVASWGTFLLTRPSSGIDPSYTLSTPSKQPTARPPDSVAGVAAKVLPSVVSLEVKGNSESGTGSGFVVKGGYIVTNNHVVAVAGQAGEIRIRYNDRSSSGARVVGRDPNSDIAVVKPDGTVRAPELPLGNSDGVVVGDPVIAVGSPLGLSGTVTTGIVSSLNRPVEAGGSTGSDYALINAIQTDAAINPGNSGGPLVNAAGEVIGVNSAIATVGGSLLGQQSGSIGLGFAIPVNQVRRIAQELITTGTARTSRIGITIDQSYQGKGVRIATRTESGAVPVTPGGPAAKAGLHAGDVILEVDGQPVSDSRELIVTIRSKAPGDQVRIKFRHDGEVRTATVTVGAAPAPTARPS